VKIKYFPDTDTLYVELIEEPSFESEETDEGIVFDYGQDGRIVGIEVERFVERFKKETADIPLPVEFRAEFKRFSSFK